MTQPASGPLPEPLPKSQTGRTVLEVCVDAARQAGEMVNESGRLVCFVLASDEKVVNIVALT